MATMQVRHKIYQYLKNKSYGKPVMAIVDQGSHFLWGAGISTVAALFGMVNPIGLIALPMLSILPRELVDQWPIEHLSDTVLDTIAFGLGGVLIVVLT